VAEQSAALHGVAEGFPFVAGFGDFLKFADGFFEQAHFAEGNAEVVVGLEVFVFAAHFAELGAKFIKHFLKRAGFDGGCRRFCSGRRGRRRWNRRRRSGRGRRVRNAGSEFVETQAVELANHVRKKLIGGKRSGRRRFCSGGRGRGAFGVGGGEGRGGAEKMT